MFPIYTSIRDIRILLLMYAIFRANELCGVPTMWVTNKIGCFTVAA
jgi:hypothetical protein